MGCSACNAIRDEQPIGDGQLPLDGDFHGASAGVYGGTGAGQCGGEYRGVCAVYWEGDGWLAWLLWVKTNKICHLDA